MGTTLPVKRPRGRPRTRVRGKSRTQAQSALIVDCWLVWLRDELAALSQDTLENAMHARDAATLTRMADGFTRIYDGACALSREQIKSVKAGIVGALTDFDRIGA